MTAAFIAQAAGLFVITTIDDLIVLSLFFGRGAGRHGTTARIVAGQYLGFGAILVAAALVAFGAARLLPEDAIPYFGLLPLALGLRAAENTETTSTEFFIAPGRHKHDEPTPVAPRGPIPKNATAKQRMARKLKTKRGRAVYAQRKTIVEPVFGQMAILQNGKQLLLRGLDGARGEWLLLAACHNLRKLHAKIGTHRRPASQGSASGRSPGPQ